MMHQNKQFDFIGIYLFLVIFKVTRISTSVASRMQYDKYSDIWNVYISAMPTEEGLKFK